MGNPKNRKSLKNKAKQCSITIIIAGFKSHPSKKILAYICLEIINLDSI